MDEKGARNEDLRERRKVGAAVMVKMNAMMGRVWCWSAAGGLAAKGRERGKQVGVYEVRCDV